MSTNQIMIAVVAIMVLSSWGFLLWLGWLGRREHAKIEAELAPIYALPISEARTQALALLGGESEFEVEAAPVDPDSLDPALPPAVRELFSKYSSVGMGETFLDRRVVGPSDEHPGFVKIGQDVEFAEILVRPGDEAVFTLDPGPTPDVSKECVPSAYHWVVEQAYELKSV